MCHEILRRILSMNVSFVFKMCILKNKGIQRKISQQLCQCTVALLSCWRQAEPELCKLIFGFCTNLKWSLNNQKPDYCCYC